MVHKYSESVFALKPKDLELESDLESVIDDLTVLNDKVPLLFMVVYLYAVHKMEHEIHCRLYLT